LLGIVEAGSDPITERRAAREVRTFKAVADDFIFPFTPQPSAKRVPSPNTGGSCRPISLPALGSKRIIDVQRADVTSQSKGEAV